MGGVTVADLGGFLQAVEDVRAKIHNHPVGGTGLPAYGTDILVNVLNQIGGLPTRNFQDGYFAAADYVSGETLAAKELQRKKGCFACVISCGRVSKVTDKIITHAAGDVQARVLVRALEMLESIRIVSEAVRNLPGDLRLFEGVPGIPAGEATARSEAPRGEVIYYVATDGSDQPSRVKIRTPPFVNIPAIDAMSPGQQLGDMPLIQASVDPCLSCTDR